MNGVKFDEIHSYNDLNLILKKIKIGIPLAKVKGIELEECDGVLDVTNALTDIVFYGNRELVFEFSKISDGDWYSNTSSLIQNALHGKTFKIILDDDKNYYYEGRVHLDANSDKRIDEVVVTCDCKPYKNDVSETVDTFDVSDSLTCSIDYKGTKRVCPIINVSEDMQLAMNGAFYRLVKGDNTVLDLILKNGINTFELVGTGIATVTYRGGIL